MSDLDPPAAVRAPADIRSENRTPELDLSDTVSNLMPSLELPEGLDEERVRSEQLKDPHPRLRHERR